MTCLPSTSMQRIWQSLCWTWRLPATFPNQVATPHLIRPKAHVFGTSLSNPPNAQADRVLHLQQLSNPKLWLVLGQHVLHIPWSWPPCSRPWPKRRSIASQHGKLGSGSLQQLRQSHGPSVVALFLPIWQVCSSTGRSWTKPSHWFWLVFSCPPAPLWMEGAQCQICHLWWPWDDQLHACCILQTRHLSTGPFVPSGKFLQALLGTCCNAACCADDTAQLTSALNSL